MLPKALFSRERAAHVDELVRARLKEHTAQEQLQQLSAARVVPTTFMIKYRQVPAQLFGHCLVLL
jgi:hypothetical protein